MRALLEHGANPNVFDADGYPPLFYTLDNRQTETALLLIQHRARLDEVLLDDASVAGTRNRFLMAIIDQIDIRILQAWLARGADINDQIGNGWTALKLAANNGNIGQVRFLLVHHANVAIKDYDGQTVLDDIRKFSSIPNYKQIIHMLRQAGAR